MTVQNLAQTLEFESLCVPAPDKQVQGAYAGDLLSWVMGNASEGNAFVTIMTNVNVVAVATLIDMSCIIFAEGVHVPDDVVQAAKDKNINLLVSPLPTYETCAKLAFALQ